MQTFLCSLIVILAALYLGNRWIPFKFKQRLLGMLGKSPAAQKSNGACGSCSACGNCGSKKTKSTKSAKLAKM